MRVLGLDTSTSATGWCVMENNVILAYGVIKPPKKLNSIEKIIYIENEVKSILKAKSVECVGIEELVTFRSAKTTRILQGLISHLEVELTKREILTILVRPSVWRKGIVKGRKREELKESSKAYVLENYGLNVSDDESDAILIARYCDKLSKV